MGVPSVGYQSLGPPARQSSHRPTPNQTRKGAEARAVPCAAGVDGGICLWRAGEDWGKRYRPNKVQMQLGLKLSSICDSNKADLN